jgi:serine/threonine protein kinase
MVWAAGHELQNGKYVVREVLGQGGFGITYKVRHVRLDAFMVIKTPNEYLRHDPDYGKYVDRFIREGQMMERFSQRSHPHIVRVRDLFEEGDIPCMVMDFVAGENLFQWVRRKGALAELEILPCIRQIGEALASIHQAGLVHRDAHPGNIMRCEDGRAMLIDFGIAKELVPSTQSSAGMAGNRGFAPYEQMFEGSRDVTVDIYCLAASLYFAVTGQRPAEAIGRKFNNTLLIAPQKHNRKLSDYVNQAILKGMALEAGDRPRSMQSWLQLLEVPKVVSPPIPLVSPPSRVRGTTPAAPKQVPPSPDPTPRIPNPVHEKQPNVQPKRISKKSWITRISWGWLLGALTGYAIVGFVLHLSSAPLWGMALTLTLALALAGAEAEAGAGTVALALALAGALTLALALAKVLAWAWAWAWSAAWAAAWAAALAGVGAGEKLVESFNWWQTSLILFGVSATGLGLGWSLRLLLPATWSLG